MVSNDQILNALRKVVHPETGKDIVTLGMIRGIDSGEKGISIVIEPKRPNDPFVSSIRSSIAKVLKETFGPDTVIAGIEVVPGTVTTRPEKDTREILQGIKNIIAVSSGKGGVGKSTIAVNLAIALALKNYRTGLLDADVFGPSIPKMFGSEDYRPEVVKKDKKDTILPLLKHGVKVLSTGFFVKPSDAVVWRGPMASNFLKQLMDQGDWGSLDYLLIDLPPGTSDIHLTLVQEVAVTGAIVVTTPQEVALADAIKGISMFRSEKIDVPVLGLVENMSWFTPAELPGNKYFIFGKEGGRKLSEKTEVPLLGQIPIIQSICENSDKGNPVVLDNSDAGKAFMSMANELIQQVDRRNREQKPTVRVRINN
jgi:ATP-binding protein involved in chromosome partitioning